MVQVIWRQGKRIYYIHELYFDFLAFLLSILITIFVEKLIRSLVKRKNRKNNHFPPICRGGSDEDENSLAVFEKMVGQCLLTNKIYYKIIDPKLERIILHLLDLDSPLKNPIVINLPLLYEAFLRRNPKKVILQTNLLSVFVDNANSFLFRKALVGFFAPMIRVVALIYPNTAFSKTILQAGSPLAILILVYLNSYINCNGSFDSVESTKIEQKNIQYLEVDSTKKNAPIVIDNEIDQPLYEIIDESEVSSITKIKCYFKQNCLGPLASGENKNKSNKVGKKWKRFIPLRQRTKTLEDIKNSLLQDTDFIEFTDKNFENTSNKIKNIKQKN